MSSSVPRSSREKGIPSVLSNCEECLVMIFPTAAPESDSSGEMT
jgi:hypothetical protein